jgi:lysophospholipase L1-like esterase
MPSRLDLPAANRLHAGMQDLRLPLLGLLLSLLAFAPAQATNTAIEAVPRDEKWMARHEGFVERAKQGDIDVLFLGDSITDNWRRADKGLPVWEREYGQLKAVNFGISGDRTQHVLWRLRHGEAEGYQPKVVVLMIGTNNTGFDRDKVTARNTPAETIEGVTAVVGELRTRFPAAKILLQAIFPRGEPGELNRVQIAEINPAIAKLHDGTHVHFIDFGAKFLDADGRLPADIMADKLHPDLKGYEIWAEAIRQPLASLLRP